jgi:hypothetical protein
MLSDRERRELAEIERHLDDDACLAATFTRQPLPRQRPPRQRRMHRWEVVLVVGALITMASCVIGGSAAGALICAATAVAILGLTPALSRRLGPEHQPP